MKETYHNHTIKYVPKMQTRKREPKDNVILCWIDFRKGKTEIVVMTDRNTATIVDVNDL